MPADNTQGLAGVVGQMLSVAKDGAAVIAKTRGAAVASAKKRIVVSLNDLSAGKCAIALGRAKWIDLS